MAKSTRLIFFGLLLILNQSQAQVNTCPRAESCFTIFITPCDSQGQVQVCLTFEILVGCVAGTIGAICSDRDINNAMAAVVPGQSVCTPMVNGGSQVGFGVMDPPTLATGASSGPITLSGRAVSCSGYTNVCNVGGNTEILLSYTTPQCPQTSTAPTPRNGAWSPFVSGSCSVSCGRGQRVRTRICNNPPPSPGGLTCPGSSSSTESCSVRPFRCQEHQCTPRRRRRCRRNPNLRFCPCSRRG